MVFGQVLVQERREIALHSKSKGVILVKAMGVLSSKYMHYKLGHDPFLLRAISSDLPKGMFSSTVT